jgi:DNA-binding response OmpR family regulator
MAPGNGKSRRPANDKTASTLRRIMVVDDEKDIVEVVKMALEKSGFVVDAFTSPRSALASFTQDYYSMVLLDIRMPVMNGFELYRQIRKLDERVRICFLTAHENIEIEFSHVSLREVLECVIKKPASVSELIRIVNEKLNMNRQS